MELTMNQKLFMMVELDFDEDADFDFHGKWELIKGKDKDFPIAWLINGNYCDDVTEAFADKVLSI